MSSAMSMTMFGREVVPAVAGTGSSRAAPSQEKSRVFIDHSPDDKPRHTAFDTSPCPLKAPSPRHGQVPLETGDHLFLHLRKVLVPGVIIEEAAEVHRLAEPA